MATKKIITTFDDLPDVLTASHISKFLHLSSKRVYELMSDKSADGLPSFKPGPRSVRVLKQDLKKWLDKKIQEAK